MVIANKCDKLNSSHLNSVSATLRCESRLRFTWQWPVDYATETAMTGSKQQAKVSPCLLIHSTHCDVYTFVRPVVRLYISYISSMSRIYIYFYALIRLYAYALIYLFTYTYRHQDRRGYTHWNKPNTLVASCWPWLQRPPLTADTASWPLTATTTSWPMTTNRLTGCCNWQHRSHFIISSTCWRNETNDISCGANLGQLSSCLYCCAVLVSVWHSVTASQWHSDCLEEWKTK